MQFLCMLLELDTEWKVVNSERVVYNIAISCCQQLRQSAGIEGRFTTRLDGHSIDRGRVDIILLPEGSALERKLKSRNKDMKTEALQEFTDMAAERPRSGLGFKIYASYAVAESVVA